MTIREALQIKFGQYPVSADYIETVLIAAGINGDEEFTKEIGQSKAFELAWAEGLFGLVTSPKSVTEGDYSISSADSDSIWRLINWLRAKWGLDPIGEALIKFKKDWSC